MGESPDGHTPRVLEGVQLLLTRPRATVRARDGSIVDPRVQAQATSGILFALLFYTLCGMTILVLFSVLRRRFRSIYMPKVRLRVCQPPLLPSSLFGWTRTVYQLEEGYLLNNVGLDAVVLLRLYRLGMRAFALMSLFGLAVIVPVNYAAGRGDSGAAVDLLHNVTISDELRALRVISIEHVPNGSWAVKAHLAFCYVVTAGLLTLIARFYHSWVQIRMHFCRRMIRLQRKRVETRSVLVRGVPTALRDESALRAYFDELGLGRVEHVVVCRHWARLQFALRRRAELLERLEALATNVVGNPVRWVEAAATMADGAPAPPPAPPSLSDAEVAQLLDGEASDGEGSQAPTPRLHDDALPLQPDEEAYYAAAFGRLCAFVDARAHAQATAGGGRRWEALRVTFESYAAWDRRVRLLRAHGSASAAASLAFVTFAHPRTAVAVARAAVSPREFVMVTLPAPEPRDVYWPNIVAPVSRPLVKVVRMALSQAALVLVAFAWLAPVSFFAGLLTLDKLQALLPGLKPLVNDMHPWVASFVQNVLPTSALAMWLGVLPVLLHFLSLFQGVEAVSWIEMDVLRKYFFYQIFNVLIIMTVAGTVLSSIELYALANVNQIFSSLGDAFAGIAPFFINYTLLQALVLAPLDLVMPGQLLLRLTRRWSPWTSTPRQWAATCIPHKTSLHYGVVYPAPLLVFIVGLTYSSIQPLILPFTTLYFGIVHTVHKYRLTYVHVPRYETGGRFAPLVVKRLLFGIGFYQIVVAGLVTVKGFYYLGLVGVAPLLVATVHVHRWFTRGCESLADTCPLRIIADELPDGDVGPDVRPGGRPAGGEAAHESPQFDPTPPGPVLVVPAPAGISAGSVALEPPSGLVRRRHDGSAAAPSKRRRPEPLFQDAERYKRFECDDKTDYHEPDMRRLAGVLDVELDCVHSYILEQEQDRAAETATPAAAAHAVGADCPPPSTTLDGIADDLQMRSYLHPAVIGRLPRLWLPRDPADDPSADL